MTNSTFDLALSLKFESENTLDWLSDFLGIYPTTYIPKGTSQFDFIKYDKNIWILTKKYSNYNGNDPIGIDSFLDSISNLLPKIEDIKQHINCSFRVSVVSEWAQICYTIKPDSLAILNRLSIPLEISVLSWGHCIDSDVEKTGAGLHEP